MKHNAASFFNTGVFRRRIEMSAEMFLLEANNRGKVIISRQLNGILVFLTCFRLAGRWCTRK